MPIASPETTDLERRVLAHERILQALIAYMARTEPRFIDHLRERFVEPMSMARHEHDHRETDDYAEEFIRAVMLLGEARAPKAKEQESDRQAARAAETQRSTGVFHEPAKAARRGSGTRKKRHLGGAGRWQVPRRLPPEGTCSCRCGLAQVVAPMTGSTHPTVPQDFSIQVAENEGMPPRPNSEGELPSKTPQPRPLDG
jgi:hypothetical protein